MSRKRPRMQILISFDPPSNISFNEIREFITTELEGGGGNRHPADPLSSSLGNVHVSKPITVWRDPRKNKKN